MNDDPLDTENLQAEDQQTTEQKNKLKWKDALKMKPSKWQETLNRLRERAQKALKKTYSICTVRRLPIVVPRCPSPVWFLFVAPESWAPVWNASLKLSNAAASPSGCGRVKQLPEVLSCWDPQIYVLNSQ